MKRQLIAAGFLALINRLSTAEIDLETPDLGSFSANESEQDYLLESEMSVEELANHASSLKASAKIHSTEVAKDISRFQEGSSLEMARQLVAKLPAPDFVINDTVRSYEPSSEEELYLTIPDGRYAHRVFGVELRDAEREVLDKFLAWVAVNELILPSGFADEHNYALRYLDQRPPDFQKAYDDILKVDNFLRNELIPIIEKVIAAEENLRMLTSGVLYGYGRDREQRPIAYISLRKMVDLQLSDEEFLTQFNVFMAYMIFNGMSPGRVEQLNVIVDVKNVGFYEVPVSMCRSMVPQNTLYFKHRLSVSYLVNLPWILRAIFEILQGIMDPFQVQKIFALGQDYQRMVERFGAENVEQQYGGELPDRTGDFFPPLLMV